MANILFESSFTKVFLVTSTKESKNFPASFIVKPEFSAITQNLGAVLYLGIGSSGIAYTLQIIAQKNANPTVLTILLSMESVFGVIAGAIHLHEVLLPREYIGCALVLCAVILAQLPLEKWIGKNRRVKS